MRLINEDSKHDPETEPYRSHYAARDILIEVQNDMNNALAKITDQESEAYRTYKHLLGFIYRDIGNACVFVEELDQGELYLQKCITLLQGIRTRPECVNAFLGANNQMGVILTKRNKFKQAHDALYAAIGVHEEFYIWTIDNNAPDAKPLSIQNLLNPSVTAIGEGCKEMNKLNTLTTYFMAQVNSKMGDARASAYYCHRTLKRQLQFSDFEHIDWALNAATLSQYYFNCNRHTESRHHMAAAQYMLDQHEAQMFQPGMSDEERAAVRETFHHRSADVMRCWAKYGLNLLLESKNRLMALSDVSNRHPLADFMGEIQTKYCLFESLRLDKYESVITDQYLLTFEDAKPVFVAVQAWLNGAKKYYAAETEASQYAKIVQDLAMLYKHLAFFESDESNQCKMHKRAADQLEGVLGLLNETYYMSTCRELWFEVGSRYASMLDIKCDLKREAESRGQPSNPDKIILLCRKAIARFQSFIASYAVAKDSDELKPGLRADEMVSILLAYFECGRLFYKLSTLDRVLPIENTKNCLKYYRWLVDAYEADRPTYETRLKDEYGVSKEMTELLPLKIMKQMG